MTSTSVRSGSASANDAPRVTIAQGTLRGARDEHTEIFRNIPYAEPPVGGLRWRAPEPAAGWDGERDATVTGPSSIQPAPPMGGGPVAVLLGPEQIGEMSEDCLNLNVRRPAGTTAGAGLPVMVWLHGGAFQYGHGSHTSYAGRALVDRGVVLVTVNYRLGALGWLAHAELSAEDKYGSSGNYGALDVVAALQWVQDNIADLGGDAGRVTVFGESAGATIAAQVAGSPLARGLVHRVISQSGSFFGPVDGWFPSGAGAADLMLADAERAGAGFLTQLGVSSIAEARALSAEQIRAASAPVPGQMPSMFYRTNVDGHLLPEPTYRMLRNGAYDDVPVLVGTNSNEGSVFVPPGMPPEQYAASLAAWTPFTERVLAAYPAESPGSMAELMRDGTFAWPARAWGRVLHERGAAPVFVYNFEHRPPFPPGPMDALGAIHTAEIPYVFGTLESPALTWTDADRAVSDLLVGYWTAFAATGDPNGDGRPTWPAYASDREESLHVTAAGAEAGPLSELDRLRMLDEFFQARHARP